MFKLHTNYIPPRVFKTVSDEKLELLNDLWLSIIAVRKPLWVADLRIFTAIPKQ